jgi:hypothetical protein
MFDGYSNAAGVVFAQFTDEQGLSAALSQKDCAERLANLKARGAEYKNTEKVLSEWPQ